MTSRELVLKTLEFENKEGRVPRHIWVLPWADYNYPNELVKIRSQFPDDIERTPVHYTEKPKTVGNKFEIGDYIDEWGCKYHNLERGIAGEVKEPIVSADDENWDDVSKIHIPYELLNFDISQVNEYCKKSDKFQITPVIPNPFERLQYIRGTEALYMDLMSPPPNMLKFIKKMHAFYCELFEKWASTDIDGLSFMDDWGSQCNLLISPELWCDLFKPMYKDFIDIAHRNGKKAFMHSDGHTLKIYSHLIELGVDALNSQVFCMGIDELSQFKGEITFWGEIDRQKILSYGTKQDVENAVYDIYQKLWDNGGCIAQCEFGPGANPDNVNTVFETWKNIHQQK